MFEKQMLKYENNTIESFSSLVDMYYAKVYYHCIKILKNDHDASDITQNTFIKAFININHLKNNDSFGAWIFVICNNEIKMFYRKNKNIDINTPKSEETKSCASLYAAIDSLDEKYRNVIILKYFSNFKLREISAITGLEEKTIKSRLYEARKILKALLSDKTVFKKLPNNKKRRCMIMYVPSIIETVNWYKKYLGWDGDNSEEDEKYGYSQIRAYDNKTAGCMYNNFKGFPILG